MKYFLFYAVTLFGGLWLQVIQNHFLGGSLFSVQFLSHRRHLLGPCAWTFGGIRHWIFMGPAQRCRFAGTLGRARAAVCGRRIRLPVFCAVNWTTQSPGRRAFFALIASAGVVLGEFLIEHFFSGGGQRPTSMSVWLQPVWNGVAAPLLFLALHSWDVVWESPRSGF